MKSKECSGHIQCGHTLRITHLHGMHGGESPMFDGSMRSMHTSSERENQTAMIDCYDVPTLVRCRGARKYCKRSYVIQGNAKPMFAETFNLVLALLNSSQTCDCSATLHTPFQFVRRSDGPP